MVSVGKFNRWAVLAVAALSLVLAASGCSNSSQAPSNEPSTTENASNPPASPEAAVKKDISVAIFDRGQVIASEGTYEKNRWTEWINENGPANASFVAIPRTDSKSKYNLLFSSGSAPDIIFEPDFAYLNQLVNQKALLPLDDLIEQHSTTYKQKLIDNPDLKKMYTSEDGNTYVLARKTDMNPLQAVVIRADWLKKLGLSMPTTTEELFAVAQAFAERDPDGNGKKDTFGFALSSWNGLIVDNMFGVSGTGDQNGSIPLYEQDGTLARDWDRMAAAVDFKKRLFDLGIVDKDFFTDKDGKRAQQHFLTGKLGIINWRLTFPDLETLKKNNPGVEVAVLRLPESPFGRFNVPWQPPFGTVGGINANTKNPEAAMQYLDFIMSTETREQLAYGTEGVHHTVDAKGCVIPATAEDIRNQIIYTPDYYLPSDSVSLQPDCVLPKTDDAQLQEEWVNLRKSMLEAYRTDPSPQLVFGLEPVVPRELTALHKPTIEKLNDIYAKAIISGTSFTVDQAVSEAQAYIRDAGVDKLDQFYIDWYGKNKDNVVHGSDLPGLIPKYEIKVFW